MASQEVKKRKACDLCTKAKAKCSPSGSRVDICGRCERLDKNCVYGESMRKRGPRTRSRMNQLEQRVETLMGMLSASDITSNTPTEDRSSASAVDSRATDVDTARSNVSSQLYLTPEDSPTQNYAGTYAVYDPVEAGHLEQDEAANLIDEFRQEYSECFPFVVVDASIETNTFRREQPFLFLSIMATMTYRDPSTQRILAETFRDQVAVRIMACTHKGLEVLQGLLVHSAYYHFFYQPGKQQLALMIQFCVATAQELGLAKKCKERDISSVAPVLSAAENRALLGTYYLAAAFAQAWRKRTTVPYTRTLARACQLFAQHPQHPSDLFIAPLVQLSELMCRVSDYFSYDNVEEAELHGDTVLDLSTNNFSAEYQRLRDAMSESIAQNISIRLVGDILDVMIFECSFHGTLWQTSSPISATAMSRSRLNMLQRSLRASQKLARTLLSVPLASLNHLVFPIWSGWFYSTLLVIKIVVLRQTGYTGSFRMNSLPHTVGDLLPQGLGASTSQRIGKMTSSLVHATPDRSNATIEETEMVSLFQSFIEKLNSAAPYLTDVGNTTAITPFLVKVAKLQEGLLTGIQSLTKQQSIFSPSAASEFPKYPSAHLNNAGLPALYEETSGDYQDLHSFQDQQQQIHAIDMQYNAASTNFPHLENPDIFAFQSGQQPPVEEWLWDMVMSDGNMFTF